MMELGCTDLIDRAHHDGSTWPSNQLTTDRAHYDGIRLC